MNGIIGLGQKINGMNGRFAARFGEKGLWDARPKWMYLNAMAVLFYYKNENKMEGYGLKGRIWKGAAKYVKPRVLNMFGS
ncbi:S2-RNase [Pyrus ussuriensis x Pyrus communis]|uniref:S2-RNase n=1 Tax=Pyrus ussuriensis x Pyrus communis TaxID=2448454 RepID=A0A5N5F2D4_9ROSA|nr:S2-RNase [Pyrus ussuriensis x Pyrus communis]